MAFPAFLRIWETFLWLLDIILLLTAATATPANIPMPIPFTLFIVCFMIVSNLHSVNIHLTSLTIAVEFSIPVVLLVYSIDVLPNKAKLRKAVDVFCQV